MKRLVVFIWLFLALSKSIFADAISDICLPVVGGKIIAQDSENTFLGRISSRYDTESIFNKYGAYGSEYSSSSTWNKYGNFGSEYSSYSPNSPYASYPPMIIKGGKVIGYLSANKAIKQSVSLNLLNAMCNE